jgi:hypothetical protein
LPEAQKKNDFGALKKLGFITKEDFTIRKK